MYILVLGNGIPSADYPKQGAFAFDQACLLRRAGLEVVYGSLDFRSLRRKRTWGFHREEKKGLPCFEISLPLGPLPQGLLEKIGGRAFARLLEKVSQAQGGPPLLVHAHFLKLGEAAAPTCRAQSIPLYLTEHSSILHETPLDPTIKRRAMALYPGLMRLVTVSESLRRNILKETGFDSTVIHNVIDTSLFSFEGGEGEKEGPFQFVSAGNLLPIKNYDILLRAFAIHLESHPESRLTLFGDGPEREGLERLVRDLHIESNVAMEGMVERSTIARAYKKAHAFVLLSRKETFGLAYVEALASGLPVIASRCGGPDEFMKEDYGELVEVGDIFGAARAMDRVHEDYDRYDRPQIAREVKAGFSGEAIASRLVALYRGDFPKLSKRA